VADMLHGVKWCRVKKLLHFAPADAKHEEAHLLQHWWWTMEHVWEHAQHLDLEDENGGRYTGDILFLEDDLVLADDFPDVVNYMVQEKKNSREQCGFHSDVAALGAWGGEMLVNARKNTFVHHTMDNFPTMGYIFNAEFWDELKQLNDTFFSVNSRKRSKAGADWAVRIGDMYAQGGMRNATPNGAQRACKKYFDECRVVVTSPTFSRVWHAGNVGLGNHATQDDGPWQLDEYKNKPPFRTADGIMKHGLRGYFGAPCDWPNKTFIEAPRKEQCTHEGSDQFSGSDRHRVTCIPDLEEETKC